ncbi:MAG: hypothetical protein ACRDSZ_14440 [Pseudonocardiaceae bacterium]
MALIPIRTTCEAGETCPMLGYDTDIGDALIGGLIDTAAAAALGFPEGEGVIRIPARDVPRVLHGIRPETFGGEART